MAHTHAFGETPTPIHRRTRLWLAGAIVPLLLAALVGLVLLWPDGDAADVNDQLGFPAELVDGTVVSLVEQDCPGSAEEGTPISCGYLRVHLTSGPDEGETVSLDWTSGGGAAQVDAGDRIVLGLSEPTPGGQPGGYYFADFQRRMPLTWLGLLFAVAVVALGRLRGIRALVALVLSLVILVRFVLPSILEGNSPVAVAIVGAAAILITTLFLSHGVNVRTSTAVLGTLVSLGITGLLAVFFVQATQLTGLASEEAGFLQAYSSQISLQGLILGGIIIGSLGVLDDVTVTQASAVWELHQANPDTGFGGLYRSAVRIGRDHIASTVNTLVLAYAGASLPLLILFTQAQGNLGNVITSETVAVEVVRTLVGSIGLVASVPVTTALTALVVTIDHAAASHGDATPAASPVGP